MTGWRRVLVAVAVAVFIGVALGLLAHEAGMDARDIQSITSPQDGDTWKEPLR